MQMKHFVILLLTGLVIVAGIVIITTANRHADKSPKIESIQIELGKELPKLPDTGASDEEWAKFREAILEFGPMEPAEADDWIGEWREYVDKKTILEEHEATLGTWQEAVESGTLVKTGAPDDNGNTPTYYDVTGDGIADFEILFSNGEPKYWRYADEEGEGYG